MSIPILEAIKKRKRNPKCFSIHTFAHRGCPISPSGPFRDNIREFVRECAEIESYDVDGVSVWCTYLADESKGVVVPLYTIEESVKHSVSPLCDHCRISGWNNHLVATRKYHLVIPRDSEWNKPIEDGVFDLQTHLLHGMIHCNGFGHLITINGIEGGSKYLTGQQIMDLWDRICTLLRTRKITLVDVSKKRTLDLRLLHGVAYGRTWFGKWGYKFFHGSFGVTEHQYVMSLDHLSSLEIQKIIDDFTYTNQYKDLKQIIHYYQNLSKTKLVTLRDILKVILTAKSNAISRKYKNAIILPAKPKFLRNKEKDVKVRKFSNVAANDSRWPVRRLEYTANIIVDALKEKKLNSGEGMTRQEARDAARLHIGDTGLIDYVIKSLNNVIVGKYIVSRVVNPGTKVLVFSIRELENDSETTDLEVEMIPASPRVVPGLNVEDDMAFLYRNVFLDYPEPGELVRLAANAVLNSKVFVKEWPDVDENDDLLRFFVRVKPSSFSIFKGILGNFKFHVPPAELITVPLYATLGDLKHKIQAALRDTYIVTEGVLVAEVIGKEEFGDDELVFGTGLESGSEVWAEGAEMNLGGDVAYESGVDDWTVRCRCGARDDDGERMVACDVCDVWQHTRCGGILDEEKVPRLFVCDDCCVAASNKIYESGANSGLIFDGCGEKFVTEGLREHLFLM